MIPISTSTLLLTWISPPGFCLEQQMCGLQGFALLTQELYLKQLCGQTPSVPKPIRKCLLSASCPLQLRVKDSDYAAAATGP